MSQTLAEKILAAHTDDRKAIAGEIIDAFVDFIMVHEVLGSRIMPVLEEMGFEKVWDPTRVLVVNDHWAPASDADSAKIHIENRRFVREQGIKYFCDVDCGISHQVLAERGLAAPGDLIIGSDSHSTTYGAFNAFSTGLAATDSALILATGRIWLRVPESIRIDVSGEFGPRIMSKDLILRIVRDLGTDGANYQSIELHGPTIEDMTVGSRMTMCNMSVEAGAKCCIMTVSDQVTKWLAERAPGRQWKAVAPDEDAEYSERIHLDLKQEPLEPMVALPHSPANGKVVSEVDPVEIDQAFIGSCTNGRLEDLKIAAEIVKGKRIHSGVRMIVTPASRDTYLAALKEGVVETLMQAGAIVTNSTCGACVGGHLGVLGPGEVCISSTNRNFRGRMGHPDSLVYLASPATVAASALVGHIADPREV
ncbi:MAG: 3-isopropylmalate dehydratase large subunit [Candidatus Thorarchaeota archaeon]